MSWLLPQDLFDAPIRYQPHQGHQHVQDVSGPRPYKGQRYCNEVDDDAQSSLSVCTHGHRQLGVLSMMGYKASGQNKIRDPGKQQDAAIGRHRSGREMVLSHPGRCERGKGKPKEKVQVCPQNLASDVLRCLKQMMMIVPVDTYVEKTENVTKKNGNQ